jgi:hypothetical protein
MFYLYEHTRPDTGIVFYVGKGSIRRAYSKHRRNAHWKSIVAKAGGFSVKEVFNSPDEELVFLAEEERIDQLKRLGFKLANKTNGGEGPSGYQHTEEAKRKITEAQTGKKHWTNFHKITEEHKAKLREARSKFVFTDEIRQKLSKAGKLRKNSPQTRAKISKAKQGSKHHMANCIEFDGKIFGTAKELAEYTGENYSTTRTRLRLYPEKFGYKVLGYTKDLKGVSNE